VKQCVGPGWSLRRENPKASLKTGKTLALLATVFANPTIPDTPVLDSSSSPTEDLDEPQLVSGREASPLDLDEPSELNSGSGREPSSFDLDEVVAREEGIVGEEYAVLVVSPSPPPRRSSRLAEKRKANGVENMDVKRRRDSKQGGD
jgi:hypothetical protein